MPTPNERQLKFLTALGPKPLAVLAVAKKLYGKSHPTYGNYVSLQNREEVKLDYVICERSGWVRPAGPRPELIEQVRAELTDAGRMEVSENVRPPQKTNLRRRGARTSQPDPSPTTMEALHQATPVSLSRHLTPRHRSRRNRN